MNIIKQAVGYLITFFTFFLTQSGIAQEFTANWISGVEEVFPYLSEHGTKGVAAPTNTPGARTDAISWTAANGDFYLFGGAWENPSNSDNFANDLWKWDGTNWTWISGSDVRQESGRYGTKGVATSDNVPGARTSAVSWLASNGDLYLFGGFGFDEGGNAGRLNDLWKWDGSNWTWLSGNKTSSKFGIYGTKGVATSDNVPGSRSSAISWIGANDELYLFGGSGFDENLVNSYKNDLWKWDGTNWTWLSGSKGVDDLGIYGVQGSPAATNVPGARGSAMTWKNNAGDLFLYGGFGRDENGSARLNDLWKWDGTNWTWLDGSSSGNISALHGVKGIASTTNTPGSRSSSVIWKRSNDEVFLFGGYAYDKNGDQGYMNDLWKWDGTNWTWIWGSEIKDVKGSYGKRGTISAENTIGARSSSSPWLGSNGDLVLFGGTGWASGETVNRLNDMWKWDGANWTWVDGFKNNQIIEGIHGTKGVASSDNIPGRRQGGMTWKGANGKVYLFGGRGFLENSGLNYFNDLWEWDGTNWTWISGSDMVAASGVYGTKGVPSASNVPGARAWSVSWTINGELYVFGGFGFDSTGTRGRLNDLWKWDGTNWTWISGSNLVNQTGTYGSLGIPDQGNSPGGRQQATAWVDGSGALYLFGGFGYDGNGTRDRLNDVWRWDGSNWTWLTGSNSVNNVGSYGDMGVSLDSNSPGARSNATAWRLSNGKVYLFGGFGFDSEGSDGRLNDLWHWDGTNWVWISGSNKMDATSNYGTKGVTSATNVLGSRSSMQVWVSSNDDVLIYGGLGIDSNGDEGVLGDLWRWDGIDWTWLGGSKIKDDFGVYEIQGEFSNSNVIGARRNGMYWTGDDGKFYLFGGYGNDVNSSGNYMNVFWSISAKASQQITFNTITTQTYGSQLNLNATSDSGLSVEYSSSNTSVAVVSGSTVTSVGVGTALITAKQSGNETYSAAKEKSQTIIVNKTPLSATADDKSKTYGAANPALTISYSGFVNGEDKTAITEPTASTTATTSTGAGSIPITLTGGSATNYSITKVDGTLTINKADLTATADDKSKTYGGANPTLTISYSGFVNGEDKAAISEPTASTTATTSTGAGAVPITLTGGSAANYSITKVDGTLTINKADLTATADDKSKTYGAANPALTISYSGFVNGEDQSSIVEPMVSTTATTSSGVGTLPIALVDGSAENYAITKIDGTLTISKAALTAMADDLTREKGEENLDFTISYSGFVNDEEISVLDELPMASSTAMLTSDRGDYDIALSGGSDDNYELTLVNGTLTVIGPVFTLPPSLNFEPTGLGLNTSESLTIENTGDGPLRITGIELPDGYQINKNSLTIAASSSDNLVISFLPTEVKTYAGDLQITSNDGVTNVSLSGDGTIVTGLDDDRLTADQLTLMPNPATNMVTIDISELPIIGTQLRIVDMLGNIKLMIRPDSTELLIVDVREYVQGVYLVLVNTSRGSIAKRLMIQR